MAARGVFGGTFDPVHLGHLRCAWEVSEALAAPVHMIPCRQPVHRDEPSAGAAHRLAMLELALAEQDRLLLDDREIRRDSPSWMIDTLASLRTDHPHDRLCLIVGEDAFAGLNRWHRWQEIFELAHLIVMSRPGKRPQWHKALSTFVNGRLRAATSELESADSGLVVRLDVTALDISGSAIRRLLVAGGDVRYLLPEAVRRYIADHRLYRPEDAGKGIGDSA